MPMRLRGKKPRNSTQVALQNLIQVCYLTLSLLSLRNNSPHCLPYNSYEVSLKNLVLDQLMIPDFIFAFIFINCLLDIVLILYKCFTNGTIIKY